MDGSSSVSARITITSALSGGNLTIRNNSGTNTGFGLINLNATTAFTGTLTLQGNTTEVFFVSAPSANAINGGASISVLANTTLSLASGVAGTNWSQAFTIAGTGAANRGADPNRFRQRHHTYHPFGTYHPRLIGSGSDEHWHHRQYHRNIGDGGNNFALNVRASPPPPSLAR